MVMERGDDPTFETSNDATGELDTAWPVDLQSLSLRSLTRDLTLLAALAAPWLGRTTRGRRKAADLRPNVVPAFCGARALDPTRTVF